MAKPKGKSKGKAGKSVAKPAKPKAAKSTRAPKVTRPSLPLPPLPPPPPLPRDEMPAPRDVARLTRYGERFGPYKIDVRWLPLQLPVG